MGALSEHFLEGDGISLSIVDNTFVSYNVYDTRWIVFRNGMDYEEWKAYLAEQYANGTPVYIIYPTAEEQDFIPLQDAEQELLNNLMTYYGVTNIYNEQGCPMWLTYVNDTKLYVDQKLLEIQQAII